MNLLTAFTELPLSRQKQNLINQFINPFYADYKQSQQLSLNEKDLKKFFKQQLRMSDYLEGTPKAQLRQLFQTKHQQDKIQDVLKKASVRTLKHLKKGVELFDKILMEEILDRLIYLLRLFAKKNSNYSYSDISLYEDKFTPQLARQWLKEERKPMMTLTSSTDQQNEKKYSVYIARKLDFYIHGFTDQFLDENERQREKIELKKVIYKIHLLLTKLIRPYFLSNEWLNHNYLGNNLFGNYGRFRPSDTFPPIYHDYNDWLQQYIYDLVSYFLPIENRPLDNELTFQSYLERIREGISSGNSNRVFSILMRNIKDKYSEWIIEVDNYIVENQRNKGIAINPDNILNIPTNRSNIQDTGIALGLNMDNAEMIQSIQRRNNLAEYLAYGVTGYDDENARQNDEDNDTERVQNAFQEMLPTDLQSPLARGIRQYGLFAIPP